MIAAVMLVRLLLFGMLGYMGNLLLHKTLGLSFPITLAIIVVIAIALSIPSVKLENKIIKKIQEKRAAEEA